jgi:hypothetical protein
MEPLFFLLEKEEKINIDNFNMPKTAVGIWVEDDIFVSKGAPFEAFDFNNYNDVKEALLAISISKFKYKYNISIIDGAVPNSSGTINALACTSDFGKILFNDNEHVVEKKFIVLQKDIIKCKVIGGNFINIDFTYYDGIVPFGEGDNTYIVKAIIRDEYELHVKANSEEEAIDVANKHEIKHWNHLELDKQYSERVLLRSARWGNFEVRRS